LQPSNTRAWQPDVAQEPWAGVKGDEVTLHNVRNCDYRTETDYTPRWETRTVRLSQLTGIDLAINYWGSPWMAHPIASFQFANAPPLCFSIETRKEIGESYSAIGGFFRQFELIYVAELKTRACSSIAPRKPPTPHPISRGSSAPDCQASKTKVELCQCQPNGWT